MEEINKQKLWEHIAKYLMMEIKSCLNADPDVSRYVLGKALDMIQDWQKEFLGEEAGK